MKIRTGGSNAPSSLDASARPLLLGCCWSLMAVLAVLGLMNLAFMALFAVLFFVDKNSRRGIMLSRLFGAATVALGMAVIADPDLIRLGGGVTA
jgi:hypothetical protein